MLVESIVQIRLVIKRHVAAEVVETEEGLRIELDVRKGSLSPAEIHLSSILAQAILRIWASAELMTIHVCRSTLRS